MQDEDDPQKRAPAERAEPARRSNGTYDKGQSGNPRGRPKKDRRIPHPETIRDMQYDVAEFQVAATIKGKVLKMNLLQANLMTLGTAGAAGDKSAARAFVGYIQQCSEFERAEMARMTKRLDGITPAYTGVSDPTQKAALKQAWDRAAAEALGTRERTTRGLKVRRKPR